MPRNLDFFVVFEDTLTPSHVPFDLRIYVNGELHIEELGLIDLTRQPIARPINNTRGTPKHVRIDIQTPCGAFNREMIFDPAFCALR